MAQGWKRWFSLLFRKNLASREPLLYHFGRGLIMAAARIEDIAQYVVWFGQDCGDPVTHLKLQKLCYYIEALYLAAKDKPLTGELFEAWAHGPVCQKLWKEYKNFGWNRIELEAKKPNLPLDVEKHVQDVLDAYFEFPASTLEKMTHNETPWRSARGALPDDAPSNAVISKEEMRSFYKAFLIDGQV